MVNPYFVTLRVAVPIFSPLENGSEVRKQTSQVDVPSGSQYTLGQSMHFGVPGDPFVAPE